MNKQKWAVFASQRTSHSQKNSTALVKKVQQCLFFLRTLKKAGLPQQLLATCYHCITESILAYSISVWCISCPAQQ